MFEEPGIHYKVVILLSTCSLGKPCCCGDLFLRFLTGFFCDLVVFETVIWLSGSNILVSYGGTDFPIRTLMRLALRCET